MHYRRSAFTLIELLIVIAIIGILAVLVIFQTSDSNRKARNAAAQSDIAEMGKAVESFRIEDAASGQVISNPPNAVDALNGTAWSQGNVFTGSQSVASLTYGAAVTKTPSSAYTYRYVTPAVSTSGRSLIKAGAGQSGYALCTNVIGESYTTYCATDAAGGSRFSSDQATQAQGLGTLSAAAAKGLVAWYQLDGSGTSTNAINSSADGNDGTLGGNFAFDSTTSGWVPGKIGGALMFNNSLQGVVGPVLSLRNAFTATAWVEVNAYGNPPFINIVGKAQGGGNCLSDVFNFVLYGGPKISVCDPNGSNTSQQAWDAYNSPPTGSWHLMVGTFDGSSGLLKEYTDGALKATTNTGYTQVVQRNQPLLISRDSFPNFGSVTIDDVRIYNRALSDAEVLQLYQGTL